MPAISSDVSVGGVLARGPCYGQVGLSSRFGIDTHRLLEDGGFNESQDWQAA